MVLFDREFIEDCVKVKTSNNQRLKLRNNISPASTQNSVIFGQNATRQFWPIFMADLLQLKKIRNIYQIYLKMVLFDGKIIEDCVKVETSNNQGLLAEK